MFIGTPGGGLCRSLDFKSNNPIWRPLTDNVGERLGLSFDKMYGLSYIGSIAVGKGDPRIIYVGTGDPVYGHYGAGILSQSPH